MKNRYLLALTYLALSLALPQHAVAKQQTKQPPIYDRLDRYLSTGVDKGFAGSVLIVKNGEIILNKGYGLADKAGNIANTPRTAFDIGSNTKQFTAAAILKLAEQEKLSISDRLGKYFPSLPADKATITIHQLLTHTAGFEEKIGSDFEIIDTSVFFETIFMRDLLHQPGARYQYSNIGYSILARVIEIASEQDYENFLFENLFAPARMYQTGYLKPEWNPTNLARGYARNVMDQGTTAARYRAQGTISWHLKGNGGLISSTEDMFRWLQALSGGEFLSQSSLTLLTTPHIGDTEGDFSIGYGWGVVDTDRNTTRLSHNGGNGAFSHTILWSLEENWSIIFATNTSSPAQERIAYTLEKILHGETIKPEPIKEGAVSFVLNFVASNPPSKSSDLYDIVKRDYSRDFDNAGILNFLSNMLMQSGDNNLWVAELLKVNTRLFPENAETWAVLAEKYWTNGHHEVAVESYEKALSLGHSNAAERLKELRKGK